MKTLKEGPIGIVYARAILRSWQVYAKWVLMWMWKKAEHVCHIQGLIHIYGRFLTQLEEIPNGDGWYGGS